jgi:hypothetical protein
MQYLKHSPLVKSPNNFEYIIDTIFKNKEPITKQIQSPINLEPTYTSVSQINHKQYFKREAGLNILYDYGIISTKMFTNDDFIEKNIKETIEKYHKSSVGSYPRCDLERLLGHYKVCMSDLYRLHIIQNVDDLKRYNFKLSHLSTYKELFNTNHIATLFKLKYSDFVYAKCPFYINIVTNSNLSTNELKQISFDFGLCIEITYDIIHDEKNSNEDKATMIKQTKKSIEKFFEKHKDLILLKSLNIDYTSLIKYRSLFEEKRLDIIKNMEKSIK